MIWNKHAFLISDLMFKCFFSAFNIFFWKIFKNILFVCIPPTFTIAQRVWKPNSCLELTIASGYELTHDWMWFSSLKRVFVVSQTVNIPKCFFYSNWIYKTSHKNTCWSLLLQHSQYRKVNNFNILNSMHIEKCTQQISKECRMNRLFCCYINWRHAGIRIS